MSFGFDLKPLARSIEKFVLINPPVVMKGRGGELDVVVGYRRILALKSLGLEKATCRDLSNSDLSTLDLLLLNLSDNLATRRFNDVEKGMILDRLILHVPRTEILDHYMPLLNLPSRESTLNIYLKLEELDYNIRVLFAENGLSFKTIQAFLEMDINSRAVIFKWLSNIKSNFNQQVQFIEYTSDISIREEKTISELLREKEFSEILEDNKLNNPQKAKLVLGVLKARRLPSLSRAEKIFQKNISGINLPDGAKINHPPFFETHDYRLEILFKNGKELKEKIDSLSNINELERIGDPWDETDDENLQH